MFPVVPVAVLVQAVFPVVPVAELVKAVFPVVPVAELVQAVFQPCSRAGTSLDDKFFTSVSRMNSC